MNTAKLDDYLWTMTYTGKKVFPLSIREVDIDIVDIAHGLSHQCRYNGHTRRFYSVAEHSVLLARHAFESPPCVQGGSVSNRELARNFLLHDAAEAYIGDIPRPIKLQWPEIKPIEKRIDELVSRKFAIPYPWPAIVHEWDTRILSDECHAMMVVHPDWHLLEPLGVKVIGWDPKKAEEEFLWLYNQLWSAV